MKCRVCLLNSNIRYILGATSLLYYNVHLFFCLLKPTLCFLFFFFFYSSVTRLPVYSLAFIHLIFPVSMRISSSTFEIVFKNAAAINLLVLSHADHHLVVMIPLPETAERFESLTLTHRWPHRDFFSIVHRARRPDRSLPRLVGLIVLLHYQHRECGLEL